MKTMKESGQRKILAIVLLAGLLFMLQPACKSKKKTGPGATEKVASAPTEKPAAPKPQPAKVSRFYSHGRSSLLRVETAESEGKLDKEKALLYRFFAVFDPEKLPDAYRSPSPIPCATALLRDYHLAQDTLTPEARQSMLPYLVRPSDSRSIFAMRIAAMKKQASRTSRPAPGLLYAQADPADERPEKNQQLADWNIVSSSQAPITVWSRKSEAAARKTLAVVTGLDMYGKFRKLMGDGPMSDENAVNDDGTPDNGVNGDLDIYLVPAADYLTDSDGICMGMCVGIGAGQKVPCWILINENLAGSDLGATLTHELFHAFQFAVDAQEENWWVEGSAVWAEGYIKNWEGDPEHGYLQDAFDKARFRLKTLSGDENLQEYAAYIFPYFLTSRWGDQLVGDIWKSCGAARQNALTAAVSGAEGASGKAFEEVFKEYALLNYDDSKNYRPPYPEELSVFDYHREEKIELVKDSAAAIVNLPPLSAYYLHIVNAIQDREATPSVLFDLREFKKNPKLAVQAVIKSGDGDKIEDWTGLSERLFCVNSQSEYFYDIFLVFSSVEQQAEVLGLNLPVYVGHDARCDAEWIGTLTYTRNFNCSEKSEGEWSESGTWRQGIGSPWKKQASKLDVEYKCSIAVSANVRMNLAAAATKASSKEEKELHELFAIVGGKVTYSQERLEGNFSLNYSKIVKQTTTYRYGDSKPFIQTSTQEAGGGGKLIPYNRSILLAPRLGVDYENGEYTLEINFAMDKCPGKSRVEDNRGNSSERSYDFASQDPLFDSYPLRNQWNMPALKGTFKGKTISGSWSAPPRKSNGDLCTDCSLTAPDNVRVTWTLNKIR